MLKEDGTVAEEEFAYMDRILAVRGDSTGSAGGAPMELLGSKTRLPVDEESHFVFTTQSKNVLYLGFEQALFRDAGDPLRFSYPGIIRWLRNLKSRWWLSNANISRMANI